MSDVPPAERSFFIEADFVRNTLHALPRFHDTLTMTAAAMGKHVHGLSVVSRILDEYQEAPQLLNPHLQEIAEPLAQCIQDAILLFEEHDTKILKAGSGALIAAVSDAFYTFSKVRGFKTVSAVWSTEPSALRYVVRFLERLPKSSTGEATVGHDNVVASADFGTVAARAKAEAEGLAKASGAAATAPPVHPAEAHATSSGGSHACHATDISSTTAPAAFPSPDGAAGEAPNDAAAGALSVDWQVEYSALLWLASLVRVPFPFALLDDDADASSAAAAASYAQSGSGALSGGGRDGGEEGANGKRAGPRLMARVVHVCTSTLQARGRVRDAGVWALARLVTRSDVVSSERDPILRAACEVVALVARRASDGEREKEKERAAGDADGGEVSRAPHLKLSSDVDGSLVDLWLGRMSVGGDTGSDGDGGSAAAGSSAAAGAAITNVEFANAAVGCAKFLTHVTKLWTGYVGRLHAMLAPHCASDAVADAIAHDDGDTAVAVALLRLAMAVGRLVLPATASGRFARQARALAGGPSPSQSSAAPPVEGGGSGGGASTAAAGAAAVPVGNANASAMQNRPEIAAFESASSARGEWDSSFDVPALRTVEALVGAALAALPHRDTAVRMIAAKALGVVASRLPPRAADEVLAAVEAVAAKPSAVDAARLHGAVCAVAECVRRGAMSPSQLSRLLPSIIATLRFDTQVGAAAVGEAARDGACFVAWAAGRVYPPGVLKELFFQAVPIMKPSVPSPPPPAIWGAGATSWMASLIVCAVMDRAVGCRRAAAAAIQEVLGRMGLAGGVEVEPLPCLTRGSPEEALHRFVMSCGVLFVQAIDYAALSTPRLALEGVGGALLHMARGESEAAATALCESMIAHAVTYKAPHPTLAVRAAAATALRVFMLPEFVAGPVATHLLAVIDTTTASATTKHGAVLALGAACEAHTSMSSSTITAIVSAATKLRGHELLRSAACTLVKGISTAKVPLPPTMLLPRSMGPPIRVDPAMKLLEMLEDSVKNVTDSVSSTAAAAVGPLLATYYGDGAVRSQGSDGSAGDGGGGGDGTAVGGGEEKSVGIATATATASSSQTDGQSTTVDVAGGGKDVPAGEVKVERDAATASAVRAPPARFAGGGRGGRGAAEDSGGTLGAFLLRLSGRVNPRQPGVYRRGAVRAFGSLQGSVLAQEVPECTEYVNVLWSRFMTCWGGKKGVAASNGTLAPPAGGSTEADTAVAGVDGCDAAESPTPSFRVPRVDVFAVALGTLLAATQVEEDKTNRDHHTRTHAVGAIAQLVLSRVAADADAKAASAGGGAVKSTADATAGAAAEKKGGKVEFIPAPRGRLGCADVPVDLTPIEAIGGGEMLAVTVGVLAGALRDTELDRLCGDVGAVVRAAAVKALGAVTPLILSVAVDAAHGGGAVPPALQSLPRAILRSVPYGATAAQLIRISISSEVAGTRLDTSMELEAASAAAAETATASTGRRGAPGNVTVVEGAGGESDARAAAAVSLPPAPDCFSIRSAATATLLASAVASSVSALCADAAYAKDALRTAAAAAVGNCAPALIAAYDASAAAVGGFVATTSGGGLAIPLPRSGLLDDVAKAVEDGYVKLLDAAEAQAAVLAEAPAGLSAAAASAKASAVLVDATMREAILDGMVRWADVVVSFNAAARFLFAQTVQDAVMAAFCKAAGSVSVHVATASAAALRAALQRESSLKDSVAVALSRILHAADAAAHTAAAEGAEGSPTAAALAAAAAHDERVEMLRAAGVTVADALPALSTVELAATDGLLTDPIALAELFKATKALMAHKDIHVLLASSGALCAMAGALAIQLADGAKQMSAHQLAVGCVTLQRIVWTVCCLLISRYPRVRFTTATAFQLLLASLPVRVVEGAAPVPDADALFAYCETLAPGKKTSEKLLLPFFGVTQGVMDLASCDLLAIHWAEAPLPEVKETQQNIVQHIRASCFDPADPSQATRRAPVKRAKPQDEGYKALVKEMGF